MCMRLLVSIFSASNQTDYRIVNQLEIHDSTYSN